MNFKHKVGSKLLATLLVAGGLLSSSTVISNAAEPLDSDADIVKTVVETDSGTMIEGMVEGVLGEIQPRWLSAGEKTRYPAEGGTWNYGFWNAKVRSYYTVNKSHGSTVKLDDKQSRSIDTASGKTSIAELWALQSDKNDQYFYRTN